MEKKVVKLKSVKYKEGYFWIDETKKGREGLNYNLVTKNIDYLPRNYDDYTFESGSCRLIIAQTNIQFAHLPYIEFKNKNTGLIDELYNKNVITTRTVYFNDALFKAHRKGFVEGFLMKDDVETDKDKLISMAYNYMNDLGLFDNPIGKEKEIKDLMDKTLFIEEIPEEVEVEMFEDASFDKKDVAWFIKKYEKNGKFYLKKVNNGLHTI